MAQLTREEILDAAVELLDEGPGALTMRSLGDRLTVTPAALYYWFPAKEQLLEAAAGHLADRIVAGPGTNGSWQDRLTAICTSVIRSAEMHPRAFNWAFTTYAKRPPLARIDETMLDVLRSAGFDARNAVIAKGTLWRFIVGHLGLAHVPAHIDPAAVDQEDHPRIHEVSAASRALTSAEYFQEGLVFVVTGLDYELRRRRRR